MDLQHYVGYQVDMAVFIRRGLDLRPRWRVPPAAMRAHYLAWCAAHDVFPLNSWDMARALREAGLVQRRTGAGRFWVGARLRERGEPGYAPVLGELVPGFDPSAKG